MVVNTVNLTTSRRHMSSTAEVSTDTMRWSVMPRPDGHHRAVVEFKSRSESKTECTDGAPVATVRATSWWPHVKQPNRPEAWDRAVLETQHSKHREKLTEGGREEQGTVEEGGELANDRCSQSSVGLQGEVMGWSGKADLRFLSVGGWRAGRSLPPGRKQTCPRTNQSTFLDIIQQHSGVREEQVG